MCRRDTDISISILAARQIGNTLRYQTILEEIVIMLDNPILFHTNIGTTRTWDDSSLL